MKRFIFISSALLILLQLTAQEKRLALVCGNSAYKNGGILKNPVNDANLMAATLRSLGFDVILKTNSDLKSMQNTLVEFGNRIKGYDIALFYYAGHGIQVDGDNYLIPVDARLEEKSLCQFEALNVDAITKTLVSGNVRLSIIILDACRNNPFKNWMRGYSRGFKPVSNQAAGSIIAFATRENEAASDGPGKYGLYTEKLVQQMKTAQNITEVFQNTRIEVLKASNNQQCPQEWNMLTGNFYFNQTGKPTENVVNETINANLISGTVVSNYGMIEIDSEIGGTLFVDDVIAGNIDANSFGNQLPNQKAGKHQVKIEGAETWIGEIEVYQNSTSKISIKSSLKPLSFDKPGFFTDKRDGKIYKTVQIGQQLWMEENLNYKTEKGSFCYDESEENAYKFGRLYNLEAAKQACPAGWRLPDKNDFEQLFSYFGKNDSSVYKSVVVSGSSGFKALLGGMREMNGASIKQNYQGYFWSSEVSENGNPWFFLVNKTTQTAYITYDNRYKYSAIMGMTDEWALSVRCIKN